jgi:hypothetical protein
LFIGACHALPIRTAIGVNPAGIMFANGFDQVKRHGSIAAPKVLAQAAVTKMCLNRALLEEPALFAE